ncbi:MAG: hypothetical protein O8C66_04145 [Candidatus Methanoperedens sp.]|nr:hypothetical protein [Candidatus Methanoperedens sp.]
MIRTLRQIVLMAYDRDLAGIVLGHLARIITINNPLAVPQLTQLGAQAVSNCKHQGNKLTDGCRSRATTTAQAAGELPQEVVIHRELNPWQLRPEGALVMSRSGFNE